VVRERQVAVSTRIDFQNVDQNGTGFFDNGVQTGGADFAESLAVRVARPI